MRFKVTFLSFFLVFFASVVCASENDKIGETTKEFFISPHVSTLGAGGSLGYEHSEYVKLRLDVNWFSFDYDESYNDVDYESDISLLTTGGLLDYHPFGNAFRMTVGAYYNNNELDLSGELSPGKSYDIGGNTYTSDEIGSLDGKVDFKDFAPYVGIGWGVNANKDKNWHFVLNIGALYQNTPNVSLDAKNPSEISKLDSDIQDEIDDIKKDVEDFEWYPVVTVGFAYRF